MKANKESGEGLPLKDQEDKTFSVQITDEYEGKEKDEEKEPLKDKVSASGEKAPASVSVEQEDTTAAVQSKTYEPSLWLAICRAFYKPFAIAAFFKLGHDILMFVSPMLLKYVSAMFIVPCIAQFS